MRLPSSLLTCLMLIFASQANGIPTTTSENNNSVPSSEKSKPTSRIIPPAPEEGRPPISSNLPGNLPSEIPNNATSQAVNPETDNLSALTQLMNSKAFQGLSICIVDPWKGLEYAKNLELEYLRNLLPSSFEIRSPEQRTFKKEISELLITSGRELQEIRERCLDTDTVSEKSEVKLQKDGDGIP